VNAASGAPGRGPNPPTPPVGGLGGDSGAETKGEAEIILPSTPANEDKPGGKKGATKRRRKDA